MKREINTFQIGKNGVSDGVIESLSLVLKNHRQIRVSVLKSSGRDKDSIEMMAKEIQQRLEVYCDFRIIGFTIILTKSDKKKNRAKRAQIPNF